MERELSDVMSMLPRLDYSDPVAARSEMNRFVRLSTMLGSHRLTDPEVDVVDRVVPSDGTSTVRVRLYVPRDRVKPAAAVIYFHGGAFVLGDLELEHPRCLEMAKETKAVVVAADYRLAPECPFPAAITDCHAVYLWVIAEADELGIDGCRIAVAGSSAGGALAAAVALMARDRGERVPAFQSLLYPVIDDRMITPSMIHFVDIQGWNRRNSEYMCRPQKTASQLGELAEDRHRFLHKRILLTGDSGLLAVPNGRECFLDSLRLVVRICPNVAVHLSEENDDLRVKAQDLADRIAFGKKVEFLRAVPDFNQFDSIPSISAKAHPKLPWTTINSNGFVARVTSGTADISDQCDVFNAIGALATA